MRLGIIKQAAQESGKTENEVIAQLMRKLEPKPGEIKQHSNSEEV
jgi:hypothetical protein